MITAYALVSGLRRLPAVVGIGSAHVEIIRHRSLVAIVSRHAAPLPRSREAVLAHAAVCEDLMTKAESVVPVRFGEAFVDEPALCASLDRRHGNLVLGLEHVRGRVEIGVRVRWDEPDVRSTERPSTGNGAGEGRLYLMARVAEERRRGSVERAADETAVVIHSALSEHTADSRLQVLPGGQLLMSAVYLVDREQLDALLATVRATARKHPDLDILCTGPWAPYSFVDAEETHAH